MIGTNDVRRDGIPGDFGNERVAKAYRAMIRPPQARKVAGDGRDLQ